MYGKLTWILIAHVFRVLKSCFRATSLLVHPGFTSNPIDADILPDVQPCAVY